MKNKYIAIIALVLFALPLFAKDGKIDNPDKNEVILVGRIVVKPNEDMNFYVQTRGVDKENLEKKGTFVIPFAPEDPDDVWDDYKDFKEANPKVTSEDGKFFCAKYKVNKKSRNLKFVNLRNFNLPNFIKYRFFDSEETYIYLPFDFNVDVPAGVEAIYIGSFYYETTGSDFVFSKISHIDEYELAQEALDKVTKKHFDLYRADLKENPKEETKKK